MYARMHVVKRVLVASMVIIGHFPCATIANYINVNVHLLGPRIRHYED